MEINIGILGAGNISKTMAKTIAQMEGVVNYAVASRDLEKASEFAAAWGVKKAYGSYLEMVQDHNIDLVYVATPHSHHYEHAKLALENGKAVLCEKAFTETAEQAEQLIQLAREKGLLLAEAIWTRYMPSRKILRDVLASGIVGEAYSLTANLAYPICEVPRMAEPSLAGGAVLDLGVYPLNFACMVFDGKIENISSSAVLTEKGVDAMNHIAITFEGGKMAVLHSNMMTVSDQIGMISGTKGYLQVECINQINRIKAFSKDKKQIAVYDCPISLTGYEYEVEAAVKAMKAGKVECEEMPHEETLRLMQIMSDLRKQWGVKES